MTFPFTEDQFFAIFENYNRAIWPVQIVAYLLGGLAIDLTSLGWFCLRNEIEDEPLMTNKALEPPNSGVLLKVSHNIKHEKINVGRIKHGPSRP